MTSICSTCRHFRPSRLPTAGHTGDCAWQPPIAPPWMREWINSEDPYYGPQREISPGTPIERCEAKDEL